MQCHACQASCPDDVRFCERCGAAIEMENPVTRTNAGNDEIHGIIHGEDGVLRWTYEMNMWTNPTILITLIKGVLIAAAVPILLVAVLGLVEKGPAESLRVLAVVAPYVLGIMLALLAIAYPIVALLNGGKYCVVFEMDDEGVNHIQMQKQFDRNKLVSMLTVLAGIAAGNPQAAGAGLLAGSRRNSYTKFSKVKTIVSRPSRDVIYVNESLSKNQVYADSDNYEVILNYLLHQCPKAKFLYRS
jgi:hypothetical protein